MNENEIEKEGKMSEKKSFKRKAGKKRSNICTT